MDKIKFLMSDTGAEITAACREALEQKGVEVTVVEKDGLKVLQKMLAVRPQVVLLDAFDGVLPAKPEICCRTPEDTRQYEEDRRLFYVAMTRARHKLVLFDCKTMPSVFVQEVIFNLPKSRAERELAKAETNRVLGRNKPAAAGPALPPVDVAAVTRVGAAVQHAVFGRGVVTEFDGRFVTVEFSGMRVKKLDAALVAEKHLLWDL